MWFAPMLKMRDKLSRKRNILLEDEEKPFLEHLDDLRKMIMRIVITLLITVTACFVFNAWFFKVVQYPMERAGLASAEERNLPAGVDIGQWKVIHAAARGAIALEGPVRELFLQAAVPEAGQRAYAEGLLLYHAAEMLPEEKQGPWLESAVKLLPQPVQAGALTAAQSIMKAKPDASLEKLRPVIETEAFAPAETFMLSMKLSTFAGIIVSFPLLFYFLLEFILPGLNSRERKLLWPALTIGFGLFLTGVMFAYFFVIPNALEFFHEYSADLGIRDGWRIGSYISFVVSFCLIFGVSFELPVVVMILVKLGLLSSATMRRTRSWAIIIIVVAGAILTPTGDIYTLSLLSGPMIIMYECCIWMAVALEKRNAKEEAEESERDMARRAALIGVASVGASRGDAGYDSGKSPGTHPDGHSGSDPHDGLHSGTVEDHSGADFHGDDPYHHDGYSAGHPHHGESDQSAADAEYEQYVKEHEHLFPATETHPENTPVEERAGSASSPPDLDMAVGDNPGPEPGGEPEFTGETPQPEEAPAGPMTDYNAHSVPPREEGTELKPGSEASPEAGTPPAEASTPSAKDEDEGDRESDPPRDPPAQGS